MCLYILIIIIINIYIYNYKYYQKIYNVLYEKGELNKDPYKRQLSSKVVIEFCKIAQKLNIKLYDEITNIQFDNIYKIYIEYQIVLSQ